jgi:hypothetical protein
MTTRLTAWLSFIGVAVWLLCRPLPSPDVWWQLAGGRWLCQHHSLPREDPFSFTAGQAAWLNHEWLAEVGMYGLMAAGGLGLLHAVRLLLVIATFMCMAWAARQAAVEEPDHWSLAAASLVALLNSAYASFFDVRPYLLTYLFLAMTMGAGLALWRSRSPWCAWLLPLVFLFWANVHSGVVIGGVVLLVLSALGGEQRRRLLVVSAVCLAASLCNPYGIDVWTFPLDFYQGTLWGRFLNEWARPDLLGAQLPFLLYWIATLALAFALRRRLVLPYLVVLGAVAVLSMTAWRHQPLFGLVSVPVWTLGVRLVRALLGEVVLDQRLGLVAAMGGLLLAGFTLGSTNLADLSMENSLFPSQAVPWLAAARLPSRLYNAYGWGGYLTWYLYPQYQVFIDGRANTLYPEVVYRDFLLVRQGDPHWHEILAHWDVHVMILNKVEGAPAPGHDLRLEVQNDAAWRKVYEDAIAIIYVERH